MARIEKTVFIAYRRPNIPWALAIFQNLTKNGYDVFFDFEGIADGDFESVILGNIKGRAHFLVLLTPSALERAGEPGDLFRKEIEFALDTERNIVPLMLEGFDFSTPAIARQLTGKLAALKRYNALEIPAAYFIESMERLRQLYLNIPLDMALHPAQVVEEQVVDTEEIAKPQQILRPEQITRAKQVAKEHQAAAKRKPPVKFYSCFISFSTKDEDFASRLRADLMAKGVLCWLATHDMRGGKKIQEQIDHAILLHDRLLLILSEHSIQSNWVKTEIAKARKREERENRTVLFPIRLIDFEKLRSWQYIDPDTGVDIAVEIRGYYIPDFSRWNEGAFYQESFERLLRDLSQNA